VWTLVDPEACFREWARVLKPGGRLLIIDGDFVNIGPLERLVKKVASLFEGKGTGSEVPNAVMAAQHQSILSRVFFSQGARAEAIAQMLGECGLTNIRIDTDLRHIHKAQASHFGFLKSLQRGLQHRYAITAEKP